MPRRYAVLLADVIASGARRGLRGFLGSRLRAASQAHLKRRWIRVPYAVTAGDEFQAIVPQAGNLPDMILDLRRRMRPLELRIAAGVGTVDGPVRAPVNRLQGEAFVRARRAMEELKRGRLHRYPALTAFRTGGKALDELINLIYGLNDTLLRGVTRKQWQALDAYGANQRVRLTARALRLDESTVSRRLRRGHYWQLAEAARTAKMLLECGKRDLPLKRQL